MSRGPRAALRGAMKFIISALVASVPTIAFAQAPATAPAAPMPAAEPLVIEEKAEPKNSINISPLGLIAGNIALTYEHLFAGTHGVIVEGVLARASGDEGDSLQFGGSVGYRWHWRGRQNSGFLGVTFTQTVGSGSVTTNASGTEMTHDMSVRSTMLTGNIGKRWMLTDAINITARLGLGWGNHVASAKEDTQEAKDAEELMNDLLAFLPIGFEGELSVGYAF
jgi:hypothetical protein